MLKNWNTVAIVSKGGGEESANVANFQIYCTKVNFPPAQLLSLHLFLQTLVQFSDPKLSHFKAAARVFFRVNQTKPVVAFSHVNSQEMLFVEKKTSMKLWYVVLVLVQVYMNGLLFCPTVKMMTIFAHS